MPEHNDHERKVDAAVAWYYRQLEAGTPPDAETFLARFADVRDALASFLADKAVFESAARPADPTATVTLGESARDPQPCERVRYFGDYELIAEIARGGMGVVYKARQVSLNRVVALKMILSGQLASEADRARFKHEAEAAANLDHPNILPIYEVGEHDGRQYFSMKLVAEESLAQFLEESPRASGREVCDLLIQVCRAVHFAHQRGILHRDLKPSNVLLDADQTPYVTDFGLAKRVEGNARLTQSGALVGTPSYMAPEQARAERQLTTAVDVYSLGAILYEALTGRPPFRGSSVMDTVLQVLERDPADPRSIHPRADRELSVIALKCLSKEPAARYESAAALADDLERWQRGEPIVARPAGRERVVKWVRRNPVPAAFTGVILLLLVTGLSVVTRLYFRSEHYRAETERERDQARTRLARQYVEKAAAAADRADPLAGLPWLVEALQVTEGKPEAELHRLHLAAVLAQAPGLVHYSPTATCVALHPDGKRIAIGEKDGVDLLPLGGDEPVVPRMRLSVPPSTLEFNPGGRRLLVAGGVGVERMGPWFTTHARVFDTSTGEPITPETKIGRDKDGATSVRFSADGSVVVAVWRGNINRETIHNEVHLYDSATLKPFGKPWEWDTWDGPEDVFVDYRRLWVIAPDMAAPPDRPQFRVWDLRTGRPAYDPIRLPGTNQLSAVLSPAGDWVAARFGDREVLLFDFATGKPGPKLVVPAELIAFAFRPDGQVVATAGKDGKIRLWDTITGRPTRPEFDVASTAQWLGLDYSPDGRTLYHHTPEGIGGWDPRTGMSVFWVQPKAVVFSPDGLHFAVLDHEGVQVRSRDGGGRAGPFLPHGGPVNAVFSPDGRYLLTSGNGVRVWDLATGRPTARPLRPPAAVPVIDWSIYDPADRVVSLDADGRVRVFDARTGEPVGAAFRPPGHWLATELSPDGKFVVTVGWAEGRSAAPSPAELAGRVRGGLGGGNLIWQGPRDVGVWDAATGKPVVAPLRHRTVDRVLVHPDGRSLLAAGHVMDYSGKGPGESPAEYTELSRWDLTTGELATPVVRRPGRLEPAARTRDGNRVLLLAPAGKPGRVAAQFWDVDTLTPVGNPIGPERDAVVQAALSPDDTRVLTVSSGGEAHVWEAATGQLVAGPFRHTSRRVGREPPLSMAAFSPDGRRLVTVTEVGYGDTSEARVWDVETGRPVTPVLRGSSSVGLAAFSPDGRRLAVLGPGPDGCDLRVWEADTGMPLTPPVPVPVRWTRPANGPVRDLSGRPRFTPDGGRLLIPSDDGVSVVDLLIEPQSADALGPIARILSGSEVDAPGGFQPLSEAAAVEARDRWQRLNPAPRTGPDPGYARQQARLAVGVENWPAADRWLTEFLRDHPDDTWALAARADAREKLTRPDDAPQADWDAVIRVADGPTVRVRRGDVFARLGRFAEAAADFAAAWASVGRPTVGAKLALARWAAGDRAGYRQVCEQLRDRRAEFARTDEGLGLAALACGLGPDSADLVRPFVPLLADILTAEFVMPDLLRPLAQGYLRTGAADQVGPLLSRENAWDASNCRYWQIQLLATPPADRLPPLTNVWRIMLATAVDKWFAEGRTTLDWTDRVIVRELQDQRKAVGR